MERPNLPSGHPERCWPARCRRRSGLAGDALARQPQDLPASHPRRACCWRAAAATGRRSGALVDLFIALAGAAQGSSRPCCRKPQCSSARPSGCVWLAIWPAALPTSASNPTRAARFPQPRPDRASPAPSFREKVHDDRPATRCACATRHGQALAVRLRAVPVAVGPNACQISDEEAADVAFIDLTTNSAPTCFEGHRLLYPRLAL